MPAPKPLRGPGRRVRDEQDARQLLDQLRLSGLNARVWCLEHDVNLYSLYWWRSALYKRDRGQPLMKPRAPGPAQVPVAEVRLPGPAPQHRYELELPNRVRIRLGDRFDEASLQRLLTVVARC